MSTGVQVLCGLRAACMFQPLTKCISADRLLRCSDIPVWKHLIDRPLTKDERASMIADLFSDRDEIEALKDLRREDAQSIIDVIDEVPLILELE